MSSHNTNTSVPTTEQVLSSLEENSSTRKGAQLDAGRVYTRHVPQLVDLVGVSLPPQARVLVRAILEGEGVWTEPEMHTLVCSLHTELATRQDPWKIWKYYFRKIEAAGFISVEVL